MASAGTRAATCRRTPRRPQAPGPTRFRVVWAGKQEAFISGTGQNAARMSVKPRTTKAASPQTGVVGRIMRVAAAHPVIALITVAGLAAAAVTVSYSTSSTVTTSVTPPTIQFLSGDDAGPSALTDYVSAFTISNNKTYMTATINGVPEATLGIDSLFKLQNIDDASHLIWLNTTQVSNAFVTAYTIQLYDASNVLKGTLTLTAASPSVSTTIPAGETFYGKLTLTLATGAGAHNVALSNTLSLATTS